MMKQRNITAYHKVPYLHSVKKMLIGQLLVDPTEVKNR